MSVPSNMVIDREAVMVAADGARLVSTVYRDPAAGPRPALLARTPYGKDDSPQIHVIDPAAAVRAGFVVITQDVRGRYASQGDWRPYESDAEDGAAAVEWAAALPYCNGVVGMYGASYQGGALLAAASRRPPSLRSIAPMLCWRDAAEGQTFRGGALELGKLLRWTMMNMSDRIARRVADPEEANALIAQAAADLKALDASLYNPLPLGEQPLLRKYAPDCEIFDYMRAADQGDYSAPAMIAAGQRHDVPALWIAGWFDAFLGGMIREFHKDKAAGLPSELLITPWSHANHTGQVGELDFGPASTKPGQHGEALGQVLLQWFTDTLVGERRSDHPTRVFAMGVNEWRDDALFPAIDTPPAAFYLTADRALAKDAGLAGTHGYTYDPDDPAPTVGGATLMGGHFSAGPRDQSTLSARDDVLLFQGPILDEPLTLADWVSAELWVESSAPSTDFVVRLLDIDDTGRQIGVTDGIRRVQMQASEGPQRIDVDLWATHYTFAPGHRVGVQITSSSFPRWNRNLNTAEPLMTGTTAVRARQTVYCGAATPSALQTGANRRPQSVVA